MTAKNKFNNLLKELNVIEDSNENNVALNLLTRPRKDMRYETPHTTVPTADYIQQIDLLFLPFDKTVIKSREKQDKADLAKVNKLRLEGDPTAKLWKNAYFKYL